MEFVEKIEKLAGKRLTYDDYGAYVSVDRLKDMVWHLRVDLAD